MSELFKKELSVRLLNECTGKPPSFEKVKELVDLGADVDVNDFYGHTPLILASTHGQLDVVKFLIEKDANMNAVAYDGMTALMWALHNNHPEVVEYLKSKGAQ